MSLCLLARHARHSQVDHVLVGRRDGTPLSAEGLREAAELGARVARLGVTEVHSSPRQRALETAAVVAKRISCKVQVCPLLDEVDFGTWTGRSFEDLHPDPNWMRWNQERGRVRPPQGESMAEAQHRILAHLDRVHSSHPNGRVLMVSHAEIIRAAILHCMHLPFEDWNRIEIPPAGVATIKMRSNGRPLVNLQGSKAA